MGELVLEFGSRWEVLAVFIAVPWWQIAVAFGVVSVLIVLAARAAGKKSD